MTRKERVHSAIARKEVDYVPLGLYAVDKDIVSKVIGRPTYVRNRIGLQLAYWEGRRDEAVECYKKDLVDFYKKIDCADIITYRDAQVVPPKGYMPEMPKKISDDKWEDRTGRVYQAIEVHDEMVCIYDPNKNKDEPEYKVEDFEDILDIDPPDESVFEVMDYLIDKLGKERYIAGPTGGFRPMELIGPDMEFGLMMYALDKDIVKAANRQSANYHDKLDRYYIRRGYDGLLVDQDFGGTNAPLISPGTFKECCSPYLMQRINHAKKTFMEIKRQNVNFSSQVILHSCGNTIPIIPDFIDSGIDCYQSLQTTAGMEIKKLKEITGGKMSFWGGVSLEKLIDGTPEDIEKEVENALFAGDGRGFILGPSQSIAMGTKYDNFMTMLDTYVNERNKYAG